MADNLVSPFLCFATWWWAGVVGAAALHFIAVAVFSVRQAADAMSPD